MDEKVKRGRGYGLVISGIVLILLVQLVMFLLIMIKLDESRAELKTQIHRVQLEVERQATIVRP